MPGRTASGFHQLGKHRLRWRRADSGRRRRDSRWKRRERRREKHRERQGDRGSPVLPAQYDRVIAMVPPLKTSFLSSDQGQLHINEARFVSSRNLSHAWPASLIKRGSGLVRAERTGSWEQQSSIQNTTAVACTSPPRRNTAENPHQLLDISFLRLVIWGLVHFNHHLLDSECLVPEQLEYRVENPA